jgi:NADH-quinone oxidoreductase subunit F
MPRFSSAASLEVFSLKSKTELDQRKTKTELKVHLGTCGISSGANVILDTVKSEVAQLGAENIIVTTAGCLGMCAREPILTVIEPTGRKTVYSDVDQDMVKGIIKEHILKGNPVTRWALDPSSVTLSSQTIRIMHNQDLDPNRIEEYIARDGYRAMAKVLSGMSPEQVIAEIKKGGLRGRGGAGFPTALKWEMVRKATGSEKYVVCNGDEGDPGAYMNRAVLEGNPHSIVEGMAIGAYAIGNVRQGYAYIRAEYPLAIETLAHAISQAHEYGLLGENILNTGFSFYLDIFPGAGAFVCGEETALLHSIEGKRGTPRQRPPFPANKGLFDKPTTLNNVETWSNVPQLIWKGADWFSNVGSEKSKGTKTFCLVGKVVNSGLIEVPLGTPMGKIVMGIGGGIPKGKKYKGVQIGGPSGGVIPIEYLNTPVDYESVSSLGAIMGSGGLVVMDEDNCMVDMAKFMLQFTRDESCGKCTPCRAGVPRMLDILTKISRGTGTMDDLRLLEEIGEMICNTSLCGLGQTAPNPLLSMIRHFRTEYESHILEKKCPAAVCASLFKAPCQHSCPVELDIPGWIASIKTGDFTAAYRIIKQRMPLPSVCGRVCHHPCEGRCRRSQIDDPVAIMHLKRVAADYAIEHGLDFNPPRQTDKNERVAIVGAGPAGLAAAWQLRLEGYQVTIFESLPVAGGMLSVAIPEYRLPRAMLKKDIDSILSLGVDLRLNTPVNDLQALMKDGYKAVILAMGAHRGERMHIPGEDLKGVYDAITYLTAFNLGRPVPDARRVAVVGGGNSAMDAARVALRRGADKVFILYRRNIDDMPAIKEDIKGVVEEGIEILELTLPTRVIGEHGVVSSIECVKLELGDFDRSGRRSPKPIFGSEFRIEVDLVIQAIGQKPGTDLINTPEIQVARNGVVVTDRRTLATGLKGVFAAGDTTTGPNTVSEAIAEGQRAASSAKRFIEGLQLDPIPLRYPDRPVEVTSTAPTEEETRPRPRVPINELDTKDRQGNFSEILLPYSRDEAINEAGRCLRCDLQAE